jgi:hypothetical protein
LRNKKAGVDKKQTISRTLPKPWPEETFWYQVVRRIVQAAVEERSGSYVLPTLARGCDCELLNPCQPSPIFYL